MSLFYLSTISTKFNKLALNKFAFWLQSVYHLRYKVLEPTVHPKATPINVSKSQTLYYLEPFLVEKERMGLTE